MTNKRFLKKLLATTAVVGTLAAGAMEAQATGIVRPTTGNTTLSAGAGNHLDRTQVVGAPNGAAANAIFAVYGGAYPAAYAAAPVQGVRFTNPHTLAADLANANIGFVDTSASAGGVWTVTQNFYLGSIGDNGTNNAASAGINVADGTGFTLTGRGATAEENTANGGAAGAGAIAANRYVSATGAGLLGTMTLTGTGFVTIQSANSGTITLNDIIAANGDNEGVVNVNTSAIFNNTLGIANAHSLQAINVGNATATFNNATSSDVLNFTSNVTGQGAMAFNTTAAIIDLTAGPGQGNIVVTGGADTGTITVQGNRAFTVGLVGADVNNQRVLSVLDNTGVTVAATRKYDAINAKGDVSIGQLNAVGGLITLAGVKTTTGNIKLYNNKADIDLNGAINAVAGSVELKIAGADGQFLNGGAVTAGNGDIQIQTSGRANAQAFTALTAIKNNITLTAGHTAGITATAVQTGTLTFDATGTGVAVNAAFGFGGADTKLSAGLVLKSEATNVKGVDLTIIDGANQYIGDISLTAGTNLSTIAFGNIGNNKVYIGNVGSEALVFKSATLAGAGVLPIINGSKIYINKFTLSSAASTLMFGDAVTFYGNIAPNAAGKGVLSLASIAKAGVNDAKVVAINVPDTTAKVQATIVGMPDYTAANSTLAKIDFSTTAAGSRFTFQSPTTATANDTLLINAVDVNLSAQSGVGGSTIAFSGTGNHALTVGAGALADTKIDAAGAKYGAVISDTVGKFTLTGTIGAAAGAIPFSTNSLASLTASQAANVVLTGGNQYIASVVMTKDALLTLGTAAANATYMIGALTNGVNINMNSTAGDITLSAGTNLGLFNTLTFSNPAGNTLNIGDGVNLAGSNIAVNTSNFGILTFQGASNVDAIIGSNAAVNKVNITGANKIVNLNKDVNSATGIDVAANATVNVKGNVSSPTAVNGKITASGAGAVLGFTNTDDIIVSGSIANNGANFAKVNVGAGKVTVQNAAAPATAAINFTDKGNLVLQNVTAAALDAIDITASKSNIGILTTDVDITRVTDIGTSTHPIEAIVFSADKKFTANNSNVFADLRTSTPNTSAAVFSYAGGDVAKTIQNIGTAENPFRTADITFAAAGTLNAGTINATKTNIVTTGDAGGSTVNITGSTGTLNLTNVTGSDTINVLKGSVGAITSTTGGFGIVNFAGSGAIAGDLGTTGVALKAVNLLGGANDTVTISGATVYAPFTQGASTLQVTQNSTIGTYVSTGGGTLALGSSTLNTGDATLSGVSNISADLNLGSTAGNVIFKTLDVSATKSMNLKVGIVANSILLPKNGTSWKVITVSDSSNGKSANLVKLLEDGKLVVSSTATNSFLRLNQRVTKDGVEIIPTRDLSSLLLNVTEGDAGILAGMFNTQSADLSGQALEFASSLGNGATKAEQDEAFKRLTGSNKVNVSMATAVQSISNTIGGRLDNVSTIAAASADELGASAGDASMKTGAWISGFAGQGNQGARKGIAGFKSKVAGGVIGFDTALNDAAVIGLAVGSANINTKYKNEKSGDKTKATAYVFSLYGSYDFGNSWVAQGSGMFGNGSVKNSALRRVGAGDSYETASAKFDTVTGAGTVLGGYKFNVAEASFVTPLAGLSYTRTTENAYKETGTRFTNLDVSDRTQEKLEGIIGVRVNNTIDMDGTLVSPEFHAFMNYDFKAKAPKVNVQFSGVEGSLPVKSSKPARTSYNLGAGVMAKADMVEYGVSYDSNISDKYFGHQGTLKVRVNF